MKVHAGLEHPPIFARCRRYYRGMIVDVAVAALGAATKPATMDVHRVLADAYKGRPLVESPR